MLIQTAEFVGSFTTVTKCPEPDRPEYAFIGRSNVGKSSLINMLTNHKKLAKVSQTPGKTQMVNYFNINREWFLVDLPGYGYARVSKSSRKKWLQLIRNYLNKRTNLQCVFLLIDSRIPPQEIDLEFANWMGELRIPFILVFTKSDKNNQGVTEKNCERFFEAFLETWESLPQYFITSSNKKEGREEVLALIEQVNEKFVLL